MAKPRLFSTAWSPGGLLDEDLYSFRAGGYGQLTAQPSHSGYVAMPPPPTATDDELREAGDPTTPGERLAELFAVRWRESDVPRRLARNPALPWAELRQLLTWRLYESLYGVSLVLDAWHNPALPLHLMANPDPEVRDVAARLLWSRTSEVLPARHFQGRLPPAEPLGLPALVAVLGRLERDASFISDSLRVRDLLDLVRHLAGLFGLPWPG